MTSGFRRIAVGLVLFGVSFGYVEAAVVVYLRAMYEPIRWALHPERSADDLFPLLSVDDLRARDQLSTTSAPAGHDSHALISHAQRLRVEFGRELATLVLLAAAAMLVARNFHQWMAAFVIAFGVWDIFFYVFLKLLLGWPASLMTWDILFLLPLPWVGPVLAPVLVAATMVAGGMTVLWCELHGRPVSFRWWQWGAIVLGGFIIVVSFCWDWRNITRGGYPNPFRWSAFLGGLTLAVLGLLDGLRPPPPARERDET